MHVGDTVYVDYQATNIDNTSQRISNTLTFSITELYNNNNANENGENLWQYDTTELYQNYIEVEEGGHIVYFNVGLEDHDNVQHNISFKIVGLRVEDTQGNITSYDVIDNS